ncbi:MAG: type I DNA topoisomerase [Anaerolineae bacterium]|jgi:DNA topoisomerase I|nr:type I DNA topoisomerase [Anaerolineae bacterium]MBT7190706.1 type I DNA topoisomerase [Anaerolineae bacterium]MBT7991509.1 type I DNA topoisomerase [Anaerolineae bacterium]
MKCKEKREVSNPEAIFNKNSTPATRGTCPECGTGMYRMGKTRAHEGMTPPPKAERKKRTVKRKGKLVIVESPAKARTVGRFLGRGYTVKASVGHIRDLLRSQLSVDVENNFEPKYRVPNDKRPIMKELKKLAKTAKEVYLATDLDREGEAIAWHLMEAAEIEPETARRVVFHEITKSAIDESFASPREINMDLVNAQQGRRILDRLVGYSISPILWEKVRGRLSAGRVQSVALRMIVEREREIEAFESVEYWSVGAELKPEGLKKTFVAKLARIGNEKAELPSEEVVKSILADMESAAYTISKIKRGTRRRKAPAPFITSTLQQDASRRLGFTAKRTMAIAQQLYEGIGGSGLITYMRTDSTNIAKSAVEEARSFISERFGEEYLPKSAPKHKTRAKGAQEAHEAVRPTSAMRTPKSIQSDLNSSQYKLYNLIWQRFIASQMSSAVYDTLKVDITGETKENEYLLRASGSAINFAGFLAVYGDKRNLNKKKSENGDENTDIPAGLEEGQIQELIRLIPKQHFTQPPPRFSEASLVQILEENAIGRPSTYAPTLSTIQARGYVERIDKRLEPTETGEIVNDLLVKHFPDIVDFGFTARMEGRLDKVAEGEEEWVNVIRDFYGPFAKELEAAKKAIPTTKREPEKIGRACPQCGHDLVIRFGRFGKFISCSDFPKCRYTEPWLEKIGVTCPDDGGNLILRKTRKKRIFYGCANYPNCEFTSWKRPISEPCPSCKGLLVISKKDEAQCIKCEESFLLDDIQKEKED